MRRHLGRRVHRVGAAFAPLFAASGIDERAIVMIALGVALQTIAAMTAARAVAARVDTAGVAGDSHAWTLPSVPPGVAHEALAVVAPVCADDVAVHLLLRDALTMDFTGDDPNMKFYQRIVDYALVTSYPLVDLLVYDAIVERVAGAGDPSRLVRREPT